MDYWDVTKLIFRRWYIAVPLLLLTIAATAYMAVAVKPDYQLTSYVQLIPAVSGPDKTVNTPQNPWNQLGLDALSQAANYATLDQTFLDTLKKSGASANIAITVGEPPAGATIEVVAMTRQQAELTTTMAIERFEGSVLNLQTSYGVRQQDLITTTRLDQGENLKRPGGKVKRAIVAVGGTGVLIAGAATIGVDVFFRRRRLRKAARAEITGTVADTGWSAPDGPSFAGPLRRRGVERRAGWPVSSSSGARPPGAEPSGAEQAVSVDERRAPTATDDTALIPKISMDATVVIPMPRDAWTAGDNGRNRR